jgi:hypothetical protein
MLKCLTIALYPECTMITLEDCTALCGFSREEVLAIAEHEHLPELVATALANRLLCQARGTERVRDMIIDNIRQAQRRGDKRHVLAQLHVLHHFLRTHREAEPRRHPWSAQFCIQEQRLGLDAR